MDWIGHGGSDGLHGYVPSLNYVVEDMGAFLERVSSENPGMPCFLFGHSTGGAVVLKVPSFNILFYTIMFYLAYFLPQLLKKSFFKKKKKETLRNIKILKMFLHVKFSTF